MLSAKNEDYKVDSQLIKRLILPTRVDLRGRRMPWHSGPQINPLIIVPNSKKKTNIK